MKGEKFILTFAIDDYKGNPWKPLDNARSDALRFKKVLIEKYGYKDYQADLFNDAATKNAIVEVLYNLSGEILEEDTIIIYFAGHGYKNNNGKGFWIPADYGTHAVTYVPNTTILQAIDDINAKHILLISDSCYSGTFISQSRSGYGNETHDELELLTSRWIFVSGGDETVGDGRKGEGSPFAQSVCGVLEQNQQVSMSAGEFFDQSIRQVSFRTSKQTPQNDFIPGKHRGGQIIFRLTDSADSLQIAETEFKFSIPDLSLQYYISRSVSPANTQTIRLSPFNEKRTEATYLENLLLTERKIILLASAGAGKSVELIHLAKNLQEQAYFIPYYKRLNHYLGQSLEEYFPAELLNVNRERTLIILDGLDEIQARFFKQAIHSIFEFSEKYPEYRFLISCRSNFYELPQKNFSGTLEGFSVFQLNDISLFEIKKYVTDIHQLDGEQFIRDAYNALLMDLLSKPFFLDILINHYKLYGNFEGKRSVIFEQAIHSYYNNAKKNNLSTSIVSRELMFAQLEKIAFSMEVMGKNYITDTELNKLYPDMQDFENCNYLPAFKRDNERQQWSFEHNNIQEYLAARFLSGLSFDTFVRIITINSARGLKVKATWTNTLSFLISIGETEKIATILNWLIENDSEIIIRFEPDRVSRDVRISLFKQIFDSYNDKNIWVMSNKFTLRDFARFGEYPEVLDFLIEKLNGGSDRITKINVARVLRDFDLQTFPQYITAIRLALLEILEDAALIPADKYLVIGTLAELGLGDFDTVNSIVQDFRNHINQNIRAALYKLIHTSGYSDEFIDVLIEGLNLSNIQDPADTRESVTLMDESFHLEQGFSAVRRLPALKKLLHAFVDVKDSYIVRVSDYNEVFDHIVDSAVNVYNDDQSVYSAMLHFLFKISNYHYSKIPETVLKFFKKTKTVWKAFTDVWASDELGQSVKRDAIDLLSDKEVTTEFLRRYQIGEFNTEDIQVFYEYTRWGYFKKDDRDALMGAVEQAADSKENLKLASPRLQNAEIYDRKIQESFDLLFKKERLVEEIELIYQVYKKDKIKSDELYGISGPFRDIEFKFALSAIELLRDFIRRKEYIEKTIVTQWILNSPQFEKYQINEIHEWIQRYSLNKISVTGGQKAFIVELLLKNPGDLRLELFFLNQCSIGLPEKNILNLTMYYDYNSEKEFTESGTIEILERFAPIQKLKSRVAQNLKSGIDDNLVRTSNAGYALRKNLKETYAGIINYIEQSEHDEYKFVEVLNYWFLKTQNAERLLTFIENSYSHALKAAAVSLLIPKADYRTFLIGYLEKQMRSDILSLDLRFEAANSLMLMGYKESFEFVGNYILEERNPNFEFSRKLHNLVKVVDLDLIPLLIELLKLSKKPAFQKDHFNSLERIILDSLFNLGTASDTNFVRVAEAIEALLNKNNDDYEDFKFLRFHIDRMAEQLNIGKSQDVSIGQVLTLWNEIA